MRAKPDDSSVSEQSLQFIVAMHALFAKEVQPFHCLALKINHIDPMHGLERGFEQGEAGTLTNEVV
jgi:hypothetical protein